MKVGSMLRRLLTREWSDQDVNFSSSKGRRSEFDVDSPEGAHQSEPALRLAWPRDPHILLYGYKYSVPSELLDSSSQCTQLSKPMDS
jgi:hypothetical protein